MFVGHSSRNIAVGSLIIFFKITVIQRRRGTKSIKDKQHNKDLMPTTFSIIFSKIFKFVSFVFSLVLEHFPGPIAQIVAQPISVTAFSLKASETPITACAPTCGLTHSQKL